MSSTTGSQNLLTNIFRPVYRYEIPTGGSTAIFTPRLDVCNIDVLTANTVTAFNAAIGDENENVYVGSNAGNDYSNLRGCSNVTALGYAAASNISNTKNSVYIGFASGANALDSSVNIAIGPNTKGNGISNIYIGSNTGSLGTGSNNILIGHNLTGSNLSNVLLIGPTPTIYGNLSTRKVGIGRDPSYNMDISGDSRITYRLGVGMEPGKATDFNNNPLTNVPHSLDVSGYSFIRGALGINSDPADYTFNLVGNMKFDDGAGRIIMQKDPCGNSVFNFESYAPGKRAIFSIKGDICADSVVAPGSTFTGDVTASNVIAVNDLSGAAAHVTNIFGTRVFGEDVSGYRGRFGRVDATDISGSVGTVTTLTSTTFSAVNFSTANIILPGYLRDALTPDGLDISDGNITAKSVIRANNFIGTLDTTSNKIGGVTLSNTNITYAGAISNTNAAANNNIGGVRLSNNTISNSGSTTSANFFGTAANSNNIGGVTLSNGVISNSSTTNNSIGGVTLSNGNITGTFQGAISTSNAVISGYIRHTLTPSNGGLDISGGNISNSATHTASNFIGTSAASNSIGGVTLSNTNLTLAGTITGSTANTSNVIGGVVLSNNNVSNSGTTTTSNIIASGYIRNALTPGTFDISTGLLASNVVLVSNTTGYIRNSATGWTIDISRGNVSNSATTTSSNFVGTSTASNSIGGVTLSNTNLTLAGTITGSTANTSNVIGGVVLSNNNVSNSGTHTSSNFVGSSDTASNRLGGITISNGLIGAGTNAPATQIHVRATATVATTPLELLRLEWADTGYDQQVGGGTKMSFYTPADNNLGTTTEGVSIAAVRTDGTEANTTNDFVVSTRLTGTTGVTERLRYVTLCNRFDVSGDVSGIAFRSAAGSVSNPTYAFVTDPSAGLYLPAVSNLGFTIAGVERMRLDSNGELGIGTTAPLGTLDVFSGSIVANRLGNIANSTDVSAIVEGSRGVGVYWQKGSNNNNCGVSFKTLSNNIFAERMRIDANTGNLAIGRDDPNSLIRLDVSGRVRILADGSTSLTSYGLNNNADTLVLQHTGNYNNVADLGKSASILFANATCNYPQARIASEMLGVTAGGYNSSLVFQLGNSTALAERMRITAAGNVGIGTSAPAASLDVSATLRVTCNTSALFDVIPSGSYATTSTNGYFAIYAAGTTNKAASNQVVSLASDPGGNHLFLNSTKIGVGTTAPTVQLDISGAPANVLLGSTTGANGLLLQASSSNNFGYIRQIASGGVLNLGASNVNNVVITQSNVTIVGLSNTTSGLILSNSNAGSAPNGNINNWNESFYFTGNSRAWGVGVETSAGSSNSLGFFNYTAAAGGPISGTRYIRGYVAGGNTGNSTSFNFTGQHRCFIKDLGYNDISGIVGLIVSANQNQTINMSGGLKRGKEAITISESLPIVTLTSNAYDKRVFGVVALAEDPEKREDAYGNFVTPLEKKKGDTRAYINSVGEGAIWVVNTGGTIEAGDYVCASSVPGYGQKQDDDLLHNYTVAKISMDCDFTAPLQPKYIPLLDASGEGMVDEKGNIRWTQEIDESGNPVFETAYFVRYLDASGGVLDTSENAIVSAFLPCTYHCA